MAFQIHPHPKQRLSVAHSPPKNTPQAPREEFYEMSGVLAASLGSLSILPEQLPLHDPHSEISKFVYARAKVQVLKKKHKLHVSLSLTPLSPLWQYVGDR